MLPESRTNKVYFSALLKSRYPDWTPKFLELLRSLSIPYGWLEGTRDIWACDYMGVQVNPATVVKFQYDPDYLKKDPNIRTAATTLKGSPLIKDWRTSKINLDGGNIVSNGALSVLTTKILKENPQFSEVDLRSTLRSALESEIILIPKERGDVVGHSDGMLRFADDGSILVNDYRNLDPKLEHSIRLALQYHTDAPFVYLPYTPVDTNKKGVQPAIGNYVNYLRVGDKIVVPTYGKKEDKQALETIQRVHPSCKVVGFRSHPVAEEGGCLHCISWSVYEGHTNAA